MQFIGFPVPHLHACDRRRRAWNTTALGLASLASVALVPVVCVGLDVDFGDAPEPYPTTLSADGARHTIVPEWQLGKRIDSEPDGQSSANADGDDCTTSDDEDGVYLWDAGQYWSLDSANIFRANNDFTLGVVASTNGYLNAWIDFNRNGSWADSGEQIATNVWLKPGTNAFALHIPASASNGLSFARFRFGSQAGLSYTGLADDGEVEDYDVYLESAVDAPLSPFVHAVGMHLMLGKQRFYYLGANCFYLPYFAQDTNIAYAGQSWRDMADEVLDRCASWGVKVVRTWAFNEEDKQEFVTIHGDWRFQISPGVYRPEALAGLDYVLNRASESNMFVVLTLVNNWDDYGGMRWYVDNSSTTYKGYARDSDVYHDQFYSDSWCRQWYRDHVRTLVNRTNTVNGRVYRDDPTIFAWQLANEPRSANLPGFTNWVYEMAAYIKSVDANHMVSTGEEGWDPEWTYNNACPNVDYAVIHCWPEPWWPEWQGYDNETRYGNAMAWVSNHISTAETVLHKPLVLSEYGITNHESGGLPLDHPYGRDAYHEGWFNVIYSSAATNGAAAGMHFWMLEADNSGHGAYWGDGVFSSHTSSVAIIQHHARELSTLTSPLMTGISRDTGGVHLDWTGVVGSPSYRVEISDDLSIWKDLGLVGTNDWTDSDPQTPTRFYRLVPEY